LLERGFAKDGGGKGLHDFAIWGHVDMLVDQDVRAAMRPFKEYVVTWSALQRPFIEARGYKEWQISPTAHREAETAKAHRG